MLASASSILKFHQWPLFGDDEDYNLGEEAAGSILGLSWSKDNNFLLYLQDGSLPEILSMKDLKDIKPMHVVTAIDNVTVAIFQRNTKKYVAMGTSMNTVALYDTKMKSIAKLFEVPGPVIGLDFNATDELLVTACSNGFVVLFSIVSGVEKAVYNVELQLTAVHFHPNRADMFGITTIVGSLCVFEVENSEPVYVSKCHAGKINDFVFCVNESAILTIGDSKFCLHCLEEKTCTYRCHLQHPPTSIAITVDGLYVAFGTSAGQIVIFETVNYLRPLMSWIAHDEAVIFLKFSNEACKPNSEFSLISDESLAKDRRDNEFQKMYDRFVNESGENIMEILRKDMLADLEENGLQVFTRMKYLMGNFEDYIEKEFIKMQSQMKDKWDLMNMVNGEFELKTEPSIESQIDSPRILE